VLNVVDDDDDDVVEDGEADVPLLAAVVFACPFRFIWGDVGLESNNEIIFFVITFKSDLMDQ